MTSITLLNDENHYNVLTNKQIFIKSKTMITLTLLLAGLSCFALFYGAINFFENI